MGRSAAGVRGIRLSEGDYVVGVACDSEGQYLLTVTENGYGKLTSPREFTEHHRGGGGIIAHNLTDKTGPLAGIKSVDTYNDILLITDEGVIIRTGVETIRVCSRSSQGVKLMRLDEGVKLISLAKADKEEEEEAEENAENTDTAENTQQPQPEPEKGE